MSAKKKMLWGGDGWLFISHKDSSFLLRHSEPQHVGQLVYCIYMILFTTVSFPREQIYIQVYLPFWNMSSFTEQLYYWAEAVLLIFQVLQ